MTTHVKFCPPGNLRRGSVPTVFTGHIGILCLAYIKMPNSQKERGVWHKPHCLFSLGTVSHSKGMLGNLPKSKFPEARSGPLLTLQAGLSKCSGLGPDMLDV